MVDRRGRLIADSSGGSTGRSYASRPEVGAALEGRAEQITRHSQTLGADILATAVPVLEHGRPHGAVRITQSVAAVSRAVRTSLLDLAALAGVVLLLALIAAALIAQQIARPIRRLDRAARSVSDGDLDVAVPVEGTTEQRSLARAFNEMTQRIKRLRRRPAGLRRRCVPSAADPPDRPAAEARGPDRSLPRRRPRRGGARGVDGGDRSAVADRRRASHPQPGRRARASRVRRSSSPMSRTERSTRWRDLARERDIALEVGGVGRARRRLVRGPRPRSF